MCPASEISNLISKHQKEKIQLLFESLDNESKKTVLEIIKTMLDPISSYYADKF